MNNLEKAMKLEEIQDQVLELIYEARDLLEGTGITQQRAERYWLGHILTALLFDESYVGSSMFTMQDTINELKNGFEEE